MYTFYGLFVCIVLICGARSDYWADRERLLQNEESLVVGASIHLTDKERLVNDYLMEVKRTEFDTGFEEPITFLPSRHLFDTLGYIEQSEVFQFIRKLPKGSLLHGHDTALASGEFLYNLTFSDNLHACVVGNRIQLKFMREPAVEGGCYFRPIELMRREYQNFDEVLRAQLTLIREDYRDVYTDIDAVWSHFMDIFITVDPLICFKPIFQAYFHRVLQELLEDNVFYIEFRTTLPTVYDLDGNLYGPLEVAAIYKEIADEFTAENPDFLGAKLIYAPIRGIDNDTMVSYIETVKGLKANFPEFFAGFDLVGQEDLGQPLVNFIDHLLEIKAETKLFFHAGETNWFGTSTDENLIDAVLLGTVRIGHGYAALKRPEVLRMVKENNIAFEICPISNQVLMLTEDLRNHPGNYLIANGFPVVISNDDPSFWGTKALSYDWYMAFMGMTSRDTDLRFLKQIAINSIQFSVYDDKILAMNLWQRKWDEFINLAIRKINRWKRLRYIFKKYLGRNRLFTE